MVYTIIEINKGPGSPLTHYSNKTDDDEEEELSTDDGMPLC